MTLQEYVTQQFVGKEKTKQQVLDDIYKSLKEGWNEKLGYVPEKPMALITVHNPKSSVIESIGFSEPNDVIQDKFGGFFSGLLNPGGTATKLLPDTGGISRPINTNSSVGDEFAESGAAGSLGGRVRIGRGGVITRGDFDLTDPFVVAPESNFIPITTSPQWSSGSQQVVVDALLTNVTTSDTIGECGLYLKLRSKPPNTTPTFLMSHDVAGASFSSGQNVNVTYTWSIA